MTVVALRRVDQAQALIEQKLHQPLFFRVW